MRRLRRRAQQRRRQNLYCRNASYCEIGLPYVDGCLLAVPTRNKEAYREMAEGLASIFKDHGALSVVECWGDDAPSCKITSFPMAVKLWDEETCLFSWITWPDRATRDMGNKAVLEDLREEKLMEGKAMPFDGKRMIFGGHQIILDS
jgi:uncharacterized protein YbaA (DUF1428 family)